MSPLGAPPAEPRELAAFPAIELAAGASMARIHQQEHSPLWFNSDGKQRFDLVSPQGTLYASEEPLGAMVEVFRSLSPLDFADVEARRLSILALRRRLAFADCTARGARRFGITAAIHSTPHYQETQRWARAFRQAGFAGIRYLVSHDPSQELVGYAVFGEGGEPAAATDLEILDTMEIPRFVLDDLARELGIVALPRLFDEP